MQNFHAETTVEKDGKLYLEHLPFAEGEMVHVFVSPAKSGKARSLEGTVVKYEQPFASVAAEDWEASK